ncbi:hypothetical protein C8Q75DRAFT_802666 [Abortiporus biennis]|nr:hypothetical protein C8Q75DRAFT_802666 [Abortiporus biennis]
MFLTARQLGDDPLIASPVIQTAVDGIDGLSTVTIMTQSLTETFITSTTDLLSSMATSTEAQGSQSVPQIETLSLLQNIPSILHTNPLAPTSSISNIPSSSQTSQTSLFPTVSSNADPIIAPTPLQSQLEGASSSHQRASIAVAATIGSLVLVGFVGIIVHWRLNRKRAIHQSNPPIPRKLSTPSFGNLGPEIFIEEVPAPDPADSTMNDFSIYQSLKSENSTVVSSPLDDSQNRLSVFQQPVEMAMTLPSLEPISITRRIHIDMDRRVSSFTHTCHDAPPAYSPPRPKRVMSSQF